MIYISSTKNEKYKFYKSLKNKKERTKSKLYMVEGIKSSNDAICSKNIVEAILISKTFYDNSSFNYPDNVDLYVINDNIFPALTDTENSQGIITVLKQSNADLSVDINKSYIFCDHLQDPGNLGTIIRTADAAGFGGVLLSNECVDLYSPKTVRSSMGSFFHIDKIENVSKDNLINLKELGFNIVCGVLSDKTVEYTSADFTLPTIIVVGNEANGISREILDISDIDVKIPIDGDAESLNVAVAAAILMYEVRRQRNKS